MVTRFRRWRCRDGCVEIVPEDAGKHGQMVASGHRAQEVLTTGADIINGLKNPGTDVGKLISGTEGSGDISLASGSGRRHQGVRKEDPETQDSRTSRVDRTDQTFEEVEADAWIRASLRSGTFDRVEWRKILSPLYRSLEDNAKGGGGAPCVHNGSGKHNERRKGWS